MRLMERLFPFWLIPLTNKHGIKNGPWYDRLWYILSLAWPSNTPCRQLTFPPNQQINLPCRYDLIYLKSYVMQLAFLFIPVYKESQIEEISWVVLWHFLLYFMARAVKIKIKYKIKVWHLIKLARFCLLYDPTF